jgi:excisionase family DNA binding protein
LRQILNIEEVADYLRVTERTVYRLVWQGALPAMKVGRQWRFEKEAIDQWLHQKRSPNVQANILVVDDEETIGLLFKKVLEDLGHNVRTVQTSAEGLQLVKQQTFELIFLDLKMPGIDGAELFRLIRDINSQVPVVIVTGYPDSEMMARALAQGPFGVMKKPFCESDIINVVNVFLKSSDI